MLAFLKKKQTIERPKLFLYNTLGREKQEFKPLDGRKVKIYTCGPTVYDYAHLGNLRAYVFADILRRTLEYGGYDIKQIINITDFGHLVGDGDDTEDKMTLALKRDGKELTLENMKALGEEYASFFIEDVKTLNIELPFAFPRASEHIPEQIAFVAALLQKGYAYKTSDGIYFDTAKFPSYGILGGGGVLPGQSRIGAHPEKHDQKDFALWKFNDSLGWEAPWGKGFPGWHIECVAMATKYLGKSFDIHTGGVDHIQIHHNNEIAEAEAASGKRFVNYWMHSAFITIEGKRIGKSEGNAIRLYQLREKGIAPLSYRYLLLTAHYRQTLNFTWESLESAQTAFQRAQRIFADLPEGGRISSEYRTKFEIAINDDLNTSEAVAVMWEMLKDETLSPQDKRETLLDFDRVLGLGFGTLTGSLAEKLSVKELKDLPSNIQELIEEREQARNAKEWARADEIRNSIYEKGFEVEDSAEGPVIREIAQ
jgi:cysteinyl-tRNA synthetase